LVLVVATEDHWACRWDVVASQNYNVSEKLVHAKAHKISGQIVKAESRSWLFVGNFLRHGE